MARICVEATTDPSARPPWPDQTLVWARHRRSPPFGAAACADRLAADMRSPIQGGHAGDPFETSALDGRATDKGRLPREGRDRSRDGGLIPFPRRRERRRDGQASGPAGAVQLRVSLERHGPAGLLLRSVDRAGVREHLRLFQAPPDGPRSARSSCCAFRSRATAGASARTPLLPHDPDVIVRFGADHRCLLTPGTGRSARGGSEDSSRDALLACMQGAHHPQDIGFFDADIAV